MSFSFRSLRHGLAAIPFVLSIARSDVVPISVVRPPDAPVDFGLRKLTDAVAANGDTVAFRTAAPQERGVRIERDDSQLGADGFRLARVEQALAITGGSARGAMYGLLDVAEQLRCGTALTAIPPRVVHASFGLRAIKFNLPFAAYRNGPYLEQHQTTVKDVKFWEAFLDMMAANRFNALTLWSLHPFEFMVVPRSFPEAQSVSDAELAEFRRLWTSIFRLAKERGIETYLVSWNIFVSPAFADAHHVAEYSKTLAHIGAGAPDVIVEDYTRECVTQVIDEYPDLTGLGVTIGERMGGQTPEERRAWLERTFYAGIAAAKRPVKFIYRAPLSAGTGSGGSTSAENDGATRAQVEKHRRNVIEPVLVDFKHNASHGHSSPELFIVHGGKLSDAYWNPPPTNYKIDWTMRNEDMIVLRWGEPDFVRQFVADNGADYIGGAIVGSETYIPALDYITADGPHKTWRYAFERQWLFYAIWGRLMHEPALPDARFAAMFEARFGKGTGEELLQTWKLASSVPLRFASFYQGTWDGALYTEGFSTWSDFAARRLIDIDALINRPVLDSHRYIGIADFVRAAGRTPPGIESPIDLAGDLERDATELVRRLAEFRSKHVVAPPLDAELTDIEAWAAFGSYFAKKLRAGVALATARAKHDEAEQARAISLLESAVGDWSRLARVGAKYNRLPVLSPAKEPFSWDLLLPEVRNDIERARAPLKRAAPEAHPPTAVVSPAGLAAAGA